MFLQIDEGKLYLETAGQGTPLLMLHGHHANLEMPTLFNTIINGFLNQLS